MFMLKFMQFGCYAALKPKNHKMGLTAARFARLCQFYHTKPIHLL